VAERTAREIEPAPSWASTVVLVAALVGIGAGFTWSPHPASAVIGAAGLVLFLVMAPLSRAARGTVCPGCQQRQGHGQHYCADCGREL
jgi:hypothetical protein